MTDKETSTNEIFTKTVVIQASAEAIWKALTEPEQMKKWMSEAEMEVTTNWRVGSLIVVRVLMYKKWAESTGTVLVCEPLQALRYTHLSSISRLPDTAENHAVFEFQLIASNEQTALKFTARNFATETIYKHLAFYWNVALEQLKKFAEGRL
jgi:uncharacterized protein YndB with AHSA1/START domain